MVVPSAATHRHHLLSREDTLLLFARDVGVPEVDVVLACCGKLGGSFRVGERHVIDQVRVSLLGPLDALLAHLHHVNLVVAAHVYSRNPFVTGRVRDSFHTTTAPRKLETLKLFTTGGIPGENDWSTANLSSDGPLAISTQRNAHNVVRVPLHVIRHVLGFVFDFTAAEIALVCSVSVHHHTQSCGHVGNPAVAVKVHILS